MPLFICKKCLKQFDHKTNFLHHIKRKTDCSLSNKNYGSKTSKKRINHKCYHCKKSFSRKDSLTRHLKICKKNINKNKIKKKTDASINSNINGNNNITHLNNFIKTPIYINLVFYAKDGIKSLNYDELVKLLGSNDNLIEALTKTINLNPNKPEHHNIYYSDLKSANGEVYENKKWVTKKIDEILETLIQAKLEDLNGILNDMNDFLNKKTRKKIKETIESFATEKRGSRKKLKSYLKPLLYSNKDMIIKTRKLTKIQDKYEKT